MPQLTVLTCPVCAAPLRPDTDRCGYCGSYIVIKTDLPRLDRSTLNQSVIQEHIREFRQRTRADQYDEEAHYGLGLAYFSLGLTEDAVDELTQAARLMPENPHIQAQLAIALHQSLMSGNAAARKLMNARVETALLLDPTQADAAALKIEVLLEEQKVDEAVRVYQAMAESVQGGIKTKIAAALEKLGALRLESADWEGAKWCWTTLASIDRDAAKRIAVRFLNMHASLVPRSIKGAPSSDTSVARPPVGGVRSRSADILRTIGATCIGFGIGFVQFLIVGFSVETNANHTISGWRSVALVLSFLLFVASPVIGGASYVMFFRSQRPVAKVPNIHRTEILAGFVDTDMIFQVVESVMTRLRSLHLVKGEPGTGNGRVQGKR